jgi:hypothetical protein
VRLYLAFLAVLAGSLMGCAKQQSNALYATPELTEVRLAKPCKLDKTGTRLAEKCQFKMRIQGVAVK